MCELKSCVGAVWQLCGSCVGAVWELEGAVRELRGSCAGAAWVSCVWAMCVCLRVVGGIPCGHCRGDVHHNGRHDAVGRGGNVPAASVPIKVRGAIMSCPTCQKNQNHSARERERDEH